MACVASYNVSPPLQQLGGGHLLCEGGVPGADGQQGLQHAVYDEQALLLPGVRHKPHTSLHGPSLGNRSGQLTEECGRKIDFNHYRKNFDLVEEDPGGAPGDPDRRTASDKGGESVPGPQLLLRQDAVYQVVQHFGGRHTYLAMQTTQYI